jgi:hypothetical protein
MWLVPKRYLNSIDFFGKVKSMTEQTDALLSIRDSIQGVLLELLMDEDVETPSDDDMDATSDLTDLMLEILNIKVIEVSGRDIVCTMTLLLDPEES